MKGTLIMAIPFALIAIGSFIGALSGATHQAYICVIATVMVAIHLGEYKKLSK